MDRAWVFTVTRNEAQILPFWARHYHTYCERLMILDDQSDDGTPEIAERLGIQVLPYPKSTGLDDLDIADACSDFYRQARGQTEWIICAEPDELVWARDIRTILDLAIRRGVDVYVPRGYQMIADAFPEAADSRQLWEIASKGAPDAMYSKPIVIRPETDIRWSVGKHGIAQSGEARISHSVGPLKLLHYRWFGEAYYRARNAKNWARVTPRGLREGWGFHGAPDAPDLTHMYDLAARARPIL